MYVYLLICIVQHMFVASTCTVRCPSHQYSQAQVLLGPTQPCGRCRWSARGSWGFSPQSRGFCSENTNASWPMICIWYDDLYMLCKFTHPDMRMKYISTVRLVYIYIYMSYIIHTQVKSSLEQENLPGLPIHIQLPGKISTGCHMEALQVCWQFTVCSLNHICLHMFFWWNLHFLPKSLSCFDRQNLHFCCWKKLAEWLQSFTWKMWPWNSTWPLQWG